MIQGPSWKGGGHSRGGGTTALPAPYSPDLNPNEQVFAKLKHLLRRSQERTTQDIWQCIGTLLGTFTAQECNNYLVNSGYAPT